MLSFNNVPERLVVPLSTVTIFADPSVNFALQFQPLTDDEDGEEDIHFDMDSPEAEKPDRDKKKGEVVSLDTFRKKGKDNKDKT